jgi:hypothetical protein
MEPRGLGCRRERHRFEVHGIACLSVKRRVGTTRVEERKVLADAGLGTTRLRRRQALSRGPVARTGQIVGKRKTVPL